MTTTESETNILKDKKEEIFIRPLDKSLYYYADLCTTISEEDLESDHFERFEFIVPHNFLKNALPNVLNAPGLMNKIELKTKGGHLSVLSVTFNSGMKSIQSPIFGGY